MIWKMISIKTEWSLSKKMKVNYRERITFGNKNLLLKQKIFQNKLKPIQANNQSMQFFNMIFLKSLKQLKVFNKLIYQLKIEINSN